MTDPKNVNREVKGTEFLEAHKSQMATYKAGLIALYNQGYLLVPDPTGLWEGHKIYFLREAPGVDLDIDYPMSFKVWENIDGIDFYEERLDDYIKSFDDENCDPKLQIYKMFRTLTNPPASNKSVLRLMGSQSGRSEQMSYLKNPLKPIDLKMAYNPVIAEDYEMPLARRLAPITWLPRAEWFPDRLKGLTIYDVLSIFPKAEADMLALIIGRAAVGRSNHKPPGMEPLIHTSRMAAIIVGKPGTGKSKLFTNLISALSLTGYTHSSINKPDGRFNMAEIALSHIAYKDDMADSDLKGLLSSGAVKSLITGDAKIKVEDKGIDAYEVMPITTIIGISNTFDYNKIYGMDPGMADRIKFIQTKEPGSLSNHGMGGLSEGSPNLKSDIHLEWLAEKLDVKMPTLMLYFARLCADLFLDATDDLELRVRTLSQRLTIQSTDHATQGLFSAILLAHAYYDERCLASIPTRGIEDKFMLADGVESLIRFLPLLAKDSPVYKYLADDIDANPLEVYHPLYGLRSLSGPSLQNWNNYHHNNHSQYCPSESMDGDPIIYLQELLKVIRMRNGANYSHNAVWIIKAFQDIEIYVRIKIPKMVADLKNMV